MNSWSDKIEASRSSNVISVKLLGIQDDIITCNYIRLVSNFRDSMQGNWAKLLDLSEWSLAVPWAFRSLVQELKNSTAHGLGALIVIPPKCPIGMWQVKSISSEISLADRVKIVTGKRAAIETLVSFKFDIDLVSI